MIVDVAVIGAGAAGSAAAARLAPAASVALIDRVAAPGWRIGETLPGAARRLLMAIGAWERFAAAGHAEAPLKVSRWGSDTAVALDSFRDPDGSGWRLDRARFEADLRAGAVARGATLIAPAAVRSLARTAGGWTVALDTGAPLAARQIIDASGRRSRLLELFGQRRVVADRLACVYQRVRQRGDVDPSTYTEAVPEGWWYTAALPGGWRIVAFHGDSDQPALRKVLRAGPLAVAQGLPGLAAAIGDVDPAEALAPALCAANSAAGSAAGTGWLAAGDSTIALDPLSSQGLFNALATGLEAGEAALAVLGGDPAAMPRHAERMARIWRAYLGHYATYYAMEDRWPTSPFWHRRIGQAPKRPGQLLSGETSS